MNRGRTSIYDSLKERGGRGKKKAYPVEDTPLRFLRLVTS